MNENYRRARAYLYKIDPNIYQDVLHDAFLNYYRRTGLNLFERSNSNVIGVVKNQYYEHLRQGMFKRNGERLPYQFTDFDDHTYYSTTPIDLVIAEETKQKLYARVYSFRSPEIAKEVLELRLVGYETKEISQILGLTTTQVNRYTNSLRQDRVGTNKSTPAEWEEIRKLSESGLTLEQIRHKTGRSVSTIWKVLNNKLKK